MFQYFLNEIAKSSILLWQFKIEPAALENKSNNKNQWFHETRAKKMLSSLSYNMIMAVISRQINKLEKDTHMSSVKNDENNGLFDGA